MNPDLEKRVPREILEELIEAVVRKRIVNQRKVPENDVLIAATRWLMTVRQVVPIKLSVAGGAGIDYANLGLSHQFAMNAECEDRMAQWFVRSREERTFGDNPAGLLVRSTF